jgi:hypothetical protein
LSDPGLARNGKERLTTIWEADGAGWRYGWPPNGPRRSQKEPKRSKQSNLSEINLVFDADSESEALFSALALLALSGSCREATTLVAEFLCFAARATYNSIAGRISVTGVVKLPTRGVLLQVADILLHCDRE